MFLYIPDDRNVSLKLTVLNVVNSNETKDFANPLSFSNWSNSVTGSALYASIALFLVLDFKVTQEKIPEL